MSRNLDELCTLLVQEFYGPVASCIFSVLLNYGRLPLRSLILYTNLHPRYVKSELVALIQQNLVVYSPIEDEDDEEQEMLTTIYEAHMGNAYALLRFATYYRLVKNRLGASAATVLSILQQLGQAEPQQIEAGLQSKKLESADINGKQPTPNAPTSSSSFQEQLDTVYPTLNLLLSSRYIKRHRQRDLLPIDDLQQEIEDEVEDEAFGGNLKASKKQQAMFQIAVSQEKRKWLDDKEIFLPVFTNSTSQLKPASGSADSSLDTTSTLSHEISDDEANIGSLKDERIRNAKAPNGLNSDLKPMDANTANGYDKPRISTNKRKAADNVPPKPSKTRKTNTLGSKTADDGRAGSVLDSQLIKAKTDNHIKFSSDEAKTGIAFRINSPKLDVSIRSERLIKQVTRSFGEPTAYVYRALLYGLERNMFRCRNDGYNQEQELVEEHGIHAEMEELNYDTEEVTGPSLSTDEILRILDPNEEPPGFDFDKTAKVKISVDQENAAKKGQPLGKPLDQSTNDHHKHNGVSKTTEKPNNQKSTLQHYRFHTVLQHLKLLASEPHRFVEQDNESKHGPWSVDFRYLMEKSIHFEVQNMVYKRFGRPGLRCLNMLKEQGKLDEKAVLNNALMKQKTLRALLGQMHEAGILDIQELPREPSRQPNRTIFLWFYDVEKCRTRILNDMYKAQSRLLQRKSYEAQKLKTLLEKVQRTDVGGREEEMLSKSENARLKQWLQTEDKILAQIGRIDEVVAIFRDF